MRSEANGRQGPEEICNEPACLRCSERKYLISLDQAASAESATRERARERERKRETNGCKYQGRTRAQWGLTFSVGSRDRRNVRPVLIFFFNFASSVCAPSEWCRTASMGCFFGRNFFGGNFFSEATFRRQLLVTTDGLLSSMLDGRQR